MAARTLEPLAAARDEACDRSGNDAIVAVPADVSDEAAVAAMISAATERWGRLDAIFNAAGISGRRYGDGPAADCTLDGWNTVISSNLTSIFLCAE
jgi:NAD(P)-dependent dehydrogenase (short-subunit alcohol dehydrogenase family)